ncbi:unnamed protein product, partial [Symbiodinium necroappetens]
YQVRVDARYPCVGKRAFSDSKAVSAAFRTPLPLRPPLQPLPLRLDLDEAWKQEAQEEEAEAEAPGRGFLWAARPWVSVCVEHFASETYKFQYKARPHRPPDSVLRSLPHERGREYAQEAVLKGRSDFEGWQEPLVVEAAQPWPRVGRVVIMLGKRCMGSELETQAGHAILRIGLPKGAPELVALRLADSASAGSSPLRWSVTSPPIVTRVAPPLLARCFPDGAPAA